MSIEPANLTGLLLTMLVLALVPGPSDVAVVAHALSRGFAAATRMVLGIILADLLFIVIAVGGMSALAQQLSLVQDLSRYLCVGMLLYLALTLWRSHEVTVSESEAPAASAASSLLAGFLITLADPKAILFYMALFPGFVDLGQVTLLDGLVVMLAATIAISAVKLSYAALAARARGWLLDRRLRLRLNQGAAVMLGAIAGLVLIRS